MDFYVYIFGRQFFKRTMDELSTHEEMRRALWMETFTTILETESTHASALPLAVKSADLALEAFDERFKEPEDPGFD